jgi:hypothetical protein
MPLLGWGWTRNGQPITEPDLRREINGFYPVSEALDQIESDTQTWRTGPSALGGADSNPDDGMR